MYKKNRLNFLFTSFIGLYILLLCLSMRCEAQDTLLKRGTDTARINQLLKTALRESNPDSAIQLLNETLQLSIAGNYARGVIKSYYGIGFKNEARGNATDALGYYRREFDWCRNARDSVPVYSHIGYLFMGAGDYLAGANNFYTGLTLQERNHLVDKYTIDFYNGLSFIYSDLQQKEKERYCLALGEQYARQLGYNYDLCHILMNKEDYFIRQNETDSALKVSLETFSLSRQYKFRDMLLLSYGSMGEILVARKQYQSAIIYLDSAIQQLAVNGFHQNDFLRMCTADMCAALCGLGKYPQAITTMLAVWKKSDFANVDRYDIAAYKTLVTAYSATHHYNEALLYDDTLSRLKDSLYNSQRVQLINHAEMDYDEAEKNRQLIQNQLLIAQQNSKITRKNTLIGGIAGGILLLLVISGGVYRNSRQKQSLQAEQIKSLEQQNKILEQENKIDVLKAAVQGEDNERGRISRELHDGIGGMLSAAIIRLSAVHNENEAITQIPSYNEAMGILSEMGDEIRKTAHNLMPEVLLKQNLPEAVRTYCNNIQDSNYPQIDFQSYGSFDGLTENFKLNVYRIIQELLKNIIQHANASHAMVQLMESENMLAITVEDNGIGFNINEPKKGIGLHNLQTRVSSMDGYMTIRSEQGKGTSVFIEFKTAENP